MNFGSFTHRRQRRPPQDGYILLWILLMMFFMSMALMSAATSVVQQMRREREQEMIHRGVQYARAIKKYLRKFGRYPTRIEELENTNNIRFLRQRYKDPMSPNGEWHLIRYGEVQMGQAGVAGIGGMQGPPAGVGSGSGGSFASGTSGSFGSGTSGSFGSGTSGSFGSAGGPVSPPQSNTGVQGGSSGQGTSAFSGPATQSSGSSQVFGGGPIIGVSSTSEKQGIHEFNGKSHYNQWQFIYDPTVDRGGLITGPYQPLKQLMPGAQIPGTTQQPGSNVMK